jgi:hypothetical protein
VETKFKLINIQELFKSQKLKTNKRFHRIGIFTRVCIIVLVLTGCRPYQELWLNPKEDTNAKLPNLKVIIDSKSIEKAMDFNYFDYAWLGTYFRADSQIYRYYITLNGDRTPPTNIRTKDNFKNILKNFGVILESPNELISNGFPTMRTSQNNKYNYDGTTKQGLIDHIKKYPDFFKQWNQNDTLINFLKRIGEFPINKLSNPFIVRYKPYSFQNVFMSDARELIHNYMDNNIIDRSDNSSDGTIEISITDNHYKIIWWWFLPSTLTVYTINLLGFPMIRHKTYITLNVKMIKGDGKIIKQYSEKGIGKATSAMYWGYGWGGGLSKNAPCGLPRTVRTFAIYDALKKIQTDIVKDLKEINSALK